MKTELDKNYDELIEELVSEVREYFEYPPREVGDFDCEGNPVYTVWNLFNDKRFLEKLGGMYTGSLSPIVVKDGHNYLRQDIIEEIADELGITLPENWLNKVRSVYTII